MIVNKCDRCGKIYNFYGKNDKANTVETVISYVDEFNEMLDNVDLCPDCVDSFNRWLENPEEDLKKDAVDEDTDEIYRLEHAFDDDYEDDEFDDWIEWARNSLVDHALTDIKKKKERKRNG